METPKLVGFVVKRYTACKAIKWRYAERKAKIGRYAVRKAKIGRYAVHKGVGGVTLNNMFVWTSNGNVRVRR